MVKVAQFSANKQQATNSLATFYKKMFFHGISLADVKMPDMSRFSRHYVRSSVWIDLHERQQGLCFSLRAKTSLEHISMAAALERNGQVRQGKLYILPYQYFSRK